MVTTNISLIKAEKDIKAKLKGDFTIRTARKGLRISINKHGRIHIT
jgi:hypothetical protein